MRNFVLSAYIPRSGGETSLVDVRLDNITFPGGEEHVTIVGALPAAIEYSIEADLYNSSDIMKLLLLKDALDRLVLPFEVVPKITLDLSYLPYARQDRAANPGEALSVKVMCDLINSMKFDVVVCYDLHSDVPAALINNLVHKTLVETTELSQVVGHIEEDYGNVVLVSPDNGATKKVALLGAAWDLPVLQGAKKRNTKTGALSGFGLEAKPEDVNGKHLYIMDDICDGGGTFIGLAAEIREKFEPASVSLFVTHGIFSKGKELLEDNFDNVFCAFDWLDNG